MATFARLRPGGMLYAPVSALDAAGQQSPAWGVGIPVHYMLVGAPTTDQIVIADQQIAQTRYRVRINHRSSVGPDWRMVIRESGRPVVLDIVGDPIDPDGRRRWTELTGITNTAETRAAQDVAPVPPSSSLPDGALAIAAGALGISSGVLVISV